MDATEFGLTGSAYVAGSWVPAGRYRRIDAPGRDVQLADAGVLPASLDGRVAIYVPTAPSLKRHHN